MSHVALQSLFDNRFASASMYRKLANFAGDIGDMALTESDVFKRTTGTILFGPKRRANQHLIS